MYNIEREVMQIYYTEIRDKCFQEQNNLKRLKYFVRQAKGEGKNKILKKIQNFEMENCKKMNKIRKKLGYN